MHNTNSSSRAHYFLHFHWMCALDVKLLINPVLICYLGILGWTDDIPKIHIQALMT